MKLKMKGLSSANSQDLTQGSIAKGILMFTIPLFLGQLLQQFYNMADAWVVGNFADTTSFAAVSTSGHMMYLLIGFFQGIGVGGGVVISKYFGQKNKKMVEKAIHTNILIGVIASVLMTVLGTIFVPQILQWIRIPAEVMPKSTTYFRIYCMGISTVVMYNICRSVMQALGDSVHPLYYLIISTFTNIALDLLLVAVLHMGVAGAAIATVVSQGLSVVLCLIRMCRQTDYTRLDWKKLRYEKELMKETLVQGVPTGIQNSVIGIGNIVIQANVNFFGAYAMSGQGAYSKIEGLVFLPIMSISMALPTYISQNLGAEKYDRAKKGAIFGISLGIISAELLGVLIYLFADGLIRFFINDDQAVYYGLTHAHIATMFFCLLAFSHCAAGVLRGCGKAIVPMVTMMSFWCIVRIIYVTLAVKVWPVYQTVAWAYPLTWSLSTITFSLFLWNMSRKGAWKPH